MNYHFFAMLSRMKYINRWGLMRNTRNENIGEHSLDAAIIAHALAVIGIERFGRSYDPDRAAVLAIFHDASEIITGDLPTPVKYHSQEIRKSYKAVEDLAVKQLLSMLPEDMMPYYRQIMEAEEDQELMRLVKAADKLSAIIKCIEEKKSGNQEFQKAEETLRKTVEEMHLPEADCFVEDFLPSYELTLDEQKAASPENLEI